MSRHHLDFDLLLTSTLDAVERHPTNARQRRWLLSDGTPTTQACALLLAFTRMELSRFTPVIDACEGDPLSQPGRRKHSWRTERRPGSGACCV